MTRPPELTEEVERQICEVLAIGADFQDAAQYVGKDPATERRWRQRGREAAETAMQQALAAGEPPSHWKRHVDPSARCYVDYCAAVSRARARAKIQAETAWRQAIVGFTRRRELQERRRRTVREGGRRGSEVEVTGPEVETQTMGPDWQAAARWLALKFPHEFNDKTHVYQLWQAIKLLRETGDESFDDVALESIAQLVRLRGLVHGNISATIKEEFGPDGRAVRSMDLHGFEKPEELAQALALIQSARAHRAQDGPSGPSGSPGGHIGPGGGNGNGRS